MFSEGINREDDVLMCRNVVIYAVGKLGEKNIIQNCTCVSREFYEPAVLQYHIAEKIQ